MANKTAGYDFTIIVPIYNEEDNMSRLEQTLAAFLPQCSRKACVLLVNDGSKDKSETLIAELCARQPHFYYISLAQNVGLSGALKAGIDYTCSPLLGYIDSDLQTHPEDFNLLLAHIDTNALVTGIRADRKDSFFKRFQSRIANGFRRMMTKDGATDTGCPLKVMQTVTAQRLPFFTGMHRFLPALVKLEGKSFMELPVRHFPRTAGVSKYHLWNRLVGPFKDCFAYRWMAHRYIRYAVKENNVTPQNMADE